MRIEHPRGKGFLCTLLLAGVLAGWWGATWASVAATDSLTLQKPEDTSVWRLYNASKKQFTVFLKWRDAADSTATYIHQPDTTGWSVTTPSVQLSAPSVRGVYNGDIDRTVSFRATTPSGVAEMVGGGNTIEIRYSINREEEWNGLVDIGVGYTPGEWVPVIFKLTNSNPPQLWDLGLEVRFSAGLVDPQGGFLVGMEDFEGFHIWRGIEPDGSDLEVIGELSKEEAFKGPIGPGGSIIDYVYFYEVLPALRTTGVYNSPEALDCLGFRIAVPLESDQFMWFDCNAFNGFTYYYLVTTFDRGYEVASGRQGLQKVDRCQPDGGFPLPDSCLADLRKIEIDVDAQDQLRRVYAVPNPYRAGGSRLTTENYHNYPDDRIRFVNVPPDCKIKVYTLAGDLVWEGEHNSAMGNIEWDTRNRGGEIVNSGVYIYRIEDSDGGEVYGRLVIIR